MPLVRVPKAVATRSMVSVSHMNIEGLGPNYPVAQYLPVGSTAILIISSVC